MSLGAQGPGPLISLMGDDFCGIGLDEGDLPGEWGGYVIG